MMKILRWTLVISRIWFLLLLGLMLSLFACGGSRGRIGPATVDSPGLPGFKVAQLADDGHTPIPLSPGFELQADGLAVQVVARELSPTEHAYFRLAYDAGRLSPLEVIPGALLPEAEAVTAAYTGTPGEVVFGFARIRADEHGGVQGSGVVFMVVFAREPYAEPRKVSGAPSGAANRVTDLAVTPVTEDVYHLQWTERNVGDYNVDGQVNIADVTPIAMRFGNSVVDGEDDLRDTPVDGNGDGVIGISDVTPLAINYGNRIDGYIVYRRSGLYADFAPVSGVLPRYLNNGEGVLPTYEYDDTGVPANTYISYEVRPVDQSGGSDEEGAGSRPQRIDPSDVPELSAEIMSIDPAQYSVEELAEIFETYLFLFGGPQLGVVDGDGTELSNSVVPEENIMSLRHEGALQLARMWQTVQPYTLEQVLQTFIDELVWDQAPTLEELLALQQEAVNDAWANYETSPDAWAIILQFNQGPELSSEPPVLTNETQLNVFQAWALTVSFVRWMETDGKGVSGVGNTLVFYPNMPGTPNDAGSYCTRLYNQWSSYSFTRRVLHAGAGAAGTVGLAVLLGNPVSLTAVAGVAVFSFIVKPPLATVYDIANNAVSNYETPVMLSAEVDPEPIPDTSPPCHAITITWSSTVPVGGDGGPSFEILVATSADGPWQVSRRTHNDVSGESFNNWTDHGGGTYSLFTSAEPGKTYLFKVRRRDIRWGPDNLVESGNHIVATVPAGASVVGLVHDTLGTPVANIKCSTSDGQRNWTAYTGADGRFRLLDITPGQRVVTFSARGFATHLEQVLVLNDVVALDITLPEYVGDVNDRPAIEEFYYEQLGNDATAGLAWIHGRVMNLDGPQIVLIQNGNEVLYQVDDSGYFHYRAVLEPGKNTFQVRAVNALGETKSEELEIMFQAEFVFRVTLTWNQGSGSDIDLYTRDPSGDVSYYSNKTINSGSLDVDNTEGYGPENFTCNWNAGEGHPEAGTYQIGVNYYADHLADESADPPVPPRAVSCTIRVVMNPETDKEQTLYYNGSVTDDNYGSGLFGGPPSWWLPTSISVDASGVASISG